MVLYLIYKKQLKLHVHVSLISVGQWCFLCITWLWKRAWTGRLHSTRQWADNSMFLHVWFLSCKIKILHFWYYKELFRLKILAYLRSWLRLLGERERRQKSWNNNNITIYRWTTWTCLRMYIQQIINDVMKKWRFVWYLTSSFLYRINSELKSKI